MVENLKKRLGSCEFWEILNKIFNRGKAFITSSYKKARLFAMNIVVNYRLNGKSDPLPDFYHAKHKLCKTSVTTREVSRFIKGLDSK